MNEDEIETVKGIGRCVGACAYAIWKDDPAIIKCRVCGRIKAIKQVPQNDAGWHLLY